VLRCDNSPANLRILGAAFLAYSPWCLFIMKTHCLADPQNLEADHIRTIIDGEDVVSLSIKFTSSLPAGHFGVKGFTLGILCS